MDWHRVAGVLCVSDASAALVGGPQPAPALVERLVNVVEERLNLCERRALNTRCAQHLDPQSPKPPQVVEVVQVREHGVKLAAPDAQEKGLEPRDANEGGNNRPSKSCTNVVACGTEICGVGPGQMRRDVGSLTGGGGRLELVLRRSRILGLPYPDASVRSAIPKSWAAGASRVPVSWRSRPSRSPPGHRVQSPSQPM